MNLTSSGSFHNAATAARSVATGTRSVSLSVSIVRSMRPGWGFRRGRVKAMMLS